MSTKRSYMVKVIQYRFGMPMQLIFNQQTKRPKLLDDVLLLHFVKIIPKNSSKNFKLHYYPTSESVLSRVLPVPEITSDSVIKFLMW